MLIKHGYSVIPKHERGGARWGAHRSLGPPLLQTFKGELASDVRGDEGSSRGQTESPGTSLYLVDIAICRSLVNCVPAHRMPRGPLGKTEIRS